MSPADGVASVNSHLARLQRAKRRKLAPRCILEAALVWCRSLASPSGVAYLVSVICLVLQTICIDAFLITYMSSAVLLTKAVEIPLLVHLAVNWREESAHRSAPSEWLAYSWVHAAKVVVLFCRVMPRLPSAADLLEEGEGSFAPFGIQFNSLFTPTMLANLLLMTPVFYALLMFRTSKAIFGTFTYRITVDLILHYDMLWHVVIDMVDQVDMFHYARLPEWDTTSSLNVQQDNLVRIQTVIPLLLFLSMVLQAQAFPGVVVDRWKIPEPSPPGEQEQQEQALGWEASRSSKCTSSSTTRARRSLATLRERSSSCVESTNSEVAKAVSSSSTSRSASLAPPPPPAPAFLQPNSALSGPPPLPPPAGHLARVPSLPPLPISPSPTLASSISALPSRASRREGSLSQVAFDFEADALEERNSRSVASSDSDRPPPRRPTLLVPEPGPPPMPRVSLASSRRSAGQPTASGCPAQLLGRGACDAGSEGRSRERYLRLEKDRRRRLHDIISAIDRQNIIVARKRSAMISIFFTDIPFLTIRLWLWITLGNQYFPGLGVKNAICIILNGMQATLVRFADRAAFRDLQDQLVRYRVRFAGQGGPSSCQASPEVPGQSPNIGSLPPPTPSEAASALSTPEEHRGRAAAVASASQASLQRGFADAERTVTRETVRSTGVCVHFWSLLLAFGIGFLVAKGERFIAAFFAWVQNPDDAPPP